MKVKTYEQFVRQVERNRIYPFSSFIPEHPSLTEDASDCEWHSDTDTENDPWQWRVRIVKDRHAAYGKFLGGKLAFIHMEFFPYLRSLLSRGTSAEQKYRDGLLSREAYRIYQVIEEAGSIDSRRLRKSAGLDAKEHKKDYDKALIELQTFGEIVVTGADWDESESGWKSMCYETAEHWLGNTHTASVDANQAKEKLEAELLPLWSDKAYRYLLKKLG